MGTPPFMAHELLDETDAVHLYRHDLESIFYIMLILATHYEIHAPEEGEDGGVRVREGKLRFRTWFETSNYKMLSSGKWAFFTKLRTFEVSPSFKDFHGWLLMLQESFAIRFQAKGQHNLQVYLMIQRRLLPGLKQPGDGVKPVAFDDGTLGGHVTYSTLIRPVPHLTGELQGLVIRYDPLKKSTPDSN
ncbi:hypothetical protein BDM02DRAFT_2074501 [Thelephora ganbajun]|uniref:Uncharacterized protein n=1 Tax=Thelephora ganbajun TaxID=370292 RepID=A0ACB6ZGV2_THEGA|nr:hypothetical protein BDM02DRAFT_2074501 [Thelephora ganbajun]